MLPNKPVVKKRTNSRVFSILKSDDGKCYVKFSFAFRFKSMKNTRPLWVLEVLSRGTQLTFDWYRYYCTSPRTIIIIEMIIIYIGSFHTHYYKLQLQIHQCLEITSFIALTLQLHVEKKGSPRSSLLFEKYWDATKRAFHMYCNTFFASLFTTKMWKWYTFFSHIVRHKCYASK